MEIKFRKADLADIKALQQLRYQLLKYEDDNFCDIPDPKWATTDECAKSFEKQINAPDSAVIVAEHEERVIGFVSGEVFNAPNLKRIKVDSELISLYVEEEYQNKKIGALLIEKFIQWAKSKNADQVKIEPYYNNEKAIKLYKREGFEDYVVILRKKL